MRSALRGTLHSTGWTDTQYRHSPRSINRLTMRIGIDPMAQKPQAGLFTPEPNNTKRYTSINTPLSARAKCHTSRRLQAPLQTSSQTTTDTLDTPDTTTPAPNNGIGH